MFYCWACTLLICSITLRSRTPVCLHCCLMVAGNPALMDKRRGGVPLPGLSSGRDDHASYPWTPRLNEQLSKWQDRSSPCERPRTYDKFYQKLPGNYQVYRIGLGLVWLPTQLSGRTCLVWLPPQLSGRTCLVWLPPQLSGRTCLIWLNYLVGLLGIYSMCVRRVILNAQQLSSRIWFGWATWNLSCVF